MSQVEKKQKQEEMNPCIQENRFVQIEAKLGVLSDIQQSIKNIEMCLTGSDTLGIPGVVKRIDNHSKALVSLQRIVWFGWGVGGAIGVIWVVFKEFI